MKPTGQDMETRGPAAAGGPGYEATLHLLTHAAVPDGLEKRVHAALAAAPRRGLILEWPWAASWMRAAAAAAIVAVVAGGGWGVYRHAQQHQPTRVIAAPPQVTAPATGGFSSAGAVRTPQTVKGPAVVETPKAKAMNKPATAGKRGVVKPKASAEQPAADAAQPVAAGAAK